ncbi:hypothetical protein BJX76DRAFT_364136 [Aspergillus varians]
MSERKTLYSTAYTVAWICALPLELAVSALMLDEEHNQAADLQDSNDPNTYKLGTIGKHNIVLICLPLGTHGAVAAAVLVQQMLRTFPAIQYGLLVGIGGGAPSQSEDIRLGDIVVSTPKNGFGGVIPYDYGKLGAGGNLRCNRTLNKPPPILLSVVSNVKAKSHLGSDVIAKRLNEVRRRTPAVSSHLMYPGLQDDILFDASYEHVGRDQEPCLGRCDGAKWITRPPRASQAPILHYGLIASGDKVMKHAQTRDTTARRHGVLCFEMEAAGVMDTLPSLVIRGISDYADSHKNKTWQGYAGAVAAAYAREILCSAPVTQRPLGCLSLAPDSSTYRFMPLWTIPFGRNKRFTGRKRELNQLSAAIDKHDQPAIIALAGLGGAGKTQMAIEAAYRARERHPDLSVLWVSATSAETIQQAWIELCGKLQLRPPETIQAAREVARWLETTHRPWLIIIDNMDDLDIWTAQHHYLPKTSNGSIVVTTRNRKLAVNAAGSAVYEVPAMNMDDAKELLRRHLIAVSPSNDDLNVHDELLTRLRCLPLAITQAAAYINANGITIADYVSLLDGDEHTAIELLSEGFTEQARSPHQAQAITLTWIESFRHIGNSDHLAAEYLAIMSCLDPADINASLLPPGKSRKKATDAIGTLAAYAFLTRQAGLSPSEEPHLSLHPLVHMAMRNWLRQDNALEAPASKAVQQLDTIFPEHDDYRRHAQPFGSWRPYLSHVTYIMNSLTPTISPQQLNLLEKYGLCLYTDGRYREAQESLYTVLQATTNLFGPRDARTINSMNNLALSYSSQYDLSSAEALQMQAHETATQILGDTHPYTVSGANTLATIYAKQGLWDQAETLGRRVVESRKLILGADDPSTLTSIENLGCTCQEQGQWEEAEQLISSVLAARKRIQGDRDPDTLRSMNNLALVYLYERAVHLAEEELGIEHSETIAYSTNLEYAYLGNGMILEAEELGMKVLDSSTRVLGAEHATTLIAMGNLASARYDLGQEKAAFDLMENCVKLCEKALGPRDPFTETYTDMLCEWEMARDGFDACGI